MNCLRCSTEINFLKTYRFDSQEKDRGIFKMMFDIEDHLIFDVYICPKCRKTEFIYKGNLGGMGSFWDE